MTDETNNYKDSEASVEVEQEQVDELIEKANALALWRERNTLFALITGMEDKRKQITLGQKDGSVKKNQFNTGYLKAMSDFIFTLKVLIELQDEEAAPTIIEENENEAE